MFQSIFFSILWATALSTVSIAANAELYNRGGGLIYDSDQDLTWTQDAGMSGWLNWGEAMAWAGNLVFGGVSGWRLPATTQHDDPSCSGDVRGVFFFESRLDCIEGEMERLTALYDPWNNDLFEYIDASGKVKRYINRTRYWTSTPYRDWIDPCIYYPDYDVPCTLANDDGDRTGFYWQWGFTGFGGINGPAYKTTLSGSSDRYAWAVHTGNVRQQGDINFDDRINVADYLLLTQFVLGLRPEPAAGDPELNVGDMNQNNQLDTGDLVLLLRTVTGQI